MPASDSLDNLVGISGPCEGFRFGVVFYDEAIDCCLQVAINHFVAETSADPKPFVWTADPKRVLAAVKRGKQALESLH